MSGGSWPPGENCTFAVVEGVHAPRLTVLGSGSPALVELTHAILTDGPWCPDSLATNRFDADLLRVRRIRVSLRVQSALASLRARLERSSCEVGRLAPMTDSSRTYACASM